METIDSPVNVGLTVLGQLAQVSLAINIGYIMIRNFRYRKNIKEIIAGYMKLSEGMEEARKMETRDWLHLIYRDSIFTFLLYKMFFFNHYDRFIIMLFATGNLLVVITSAYLSVFSGPNLPSLTEYTFHDYNQLVFAFELTSILVTFIFVLLGRYCQKYAQKAADAVYSKIIHQAWESSMHVLTKGDSI